MERLNKKNDSQEKSTEIKKHNVYHFAPIYLFQKSAFPMTEYAVIFILNKKF